MTKKITNDTEYEVIEVPDGNGRIRLMVPTQEPIHEEIDELHKAVAEVIINIYRAKTKMRGGEK